MNKIVNLRSAKYLVRRYEKFLKMDIPEEVAFVDALIKTTGFGTDCILCREVIRKSWTLNCNVCIWSLGYKMRGNLSHYCLNKNFKAMINLQSHKKGKKLLIERIAMLKELIKKAESKK